MATITLTSEEQTINLVTEGSVSLSASNGKSAYQSYLSTTTDDPVLTEAEWSEGGGGGGGGGDYLPLAGGIMDNGAEIAFDNDSKIRQTPGSNGIDQVCSIDYVHRWKEGSLYIMDQSGGIRSVQYGLSFTPDSTFDVTGGYLVGSRFIKDDGTVFECTDNTDGAAVWVDVTPLTEVEVTSATATDISGLLKGDGTSVSAATAGTDYVATDDSRLSDSRTPTSHVHGGISNAGAIGSTSGLPIKTGTSGVLEVGAFGTSSGQFAQGNDARFHDRSHAITSTADHTAGNWKVFHSNGSGQLAELALGADGTYLKSNGASAAPSFAAQSSITGTGFAYVRTTGNNATAVIGDPSKPYSSVTEAYNAGARSFDLGPGQFGLSQSFAPGGQTTSIYVRGVGVSGSNISVFVLSWFGANGYYNNGSDYANGVTPPPLILSSDKSVDLRVTLGGGDSPPLAGYSAGNVPNYEFRNCYITLLTLTPGSGVSGGTAGNQAGDGKIEFTTIVSGTPVATALKRNGVLQGTDTFYPNNVTTATSTSITGLLKGNGTAVSAATAGTDYVEPSTFSTHTGSTTAHGISAFGATLVDDVDAAAARSTIGLATTDRPVFAGITLGQSILFSSDNTHSIGATGANRPLNIFLSGTLNAATNVFISSNSGAVYSGAGADTNISRKSAGVWQFGTNTVNSSGSWEATNGTLLGSLTVPKTITAGGTTGAQTINKISGSVNFAAAATSLVVTNSLVTASSVIQCTVATNDTTMKSVSVVAGAGSFTIYANAAPTAETRVNFSLTN